MAAASLHQSPQAGGASPSGQFSIRPRVEIELQRPKKKPADAGFFVDGRP
jgi:hypothetical protein